MMKTQEWAVATGVAAVIMLGYIHQFVFPRTEAEALKQEVSALRSNQADLEKTLNTEVRTMGGEIIKMGAKIDTLQSVLLAPAAPAQQPQSAAVVASPPGRKPDSFRSDPRSR